MSRCRSLAAWRTVRRSSSTSRLFSRSSARAWSKAKHLRPRAHPKRAMLQNLLQPPQHRANLGRALVRVVGRSRRLPLPPPRPPTPAPRHLRSIRQRSSTRHQCYRSKSRVSPVAVRRNGRARANDERRSAPSFRHSREPTWSRPIRCCCARCNATLPRIRSRSRYRRWNALEHAVSLTLLTVTSICW